VKTKYSFERYALDIAKSREFQDIIMQVRLWFKPIRKLKHIRVFHFLQIEFYFQDGAYGEML